MESSSLKLIMLQGPREGETLTFKPGYPIRIGRLVRGNTVLIKDDGISSKHLSIEFESGKWVIRDLDSSNGTLFNDSKLHPFTPFDIRHGDTVKIGEYTSIKLEIEVKVDDDGENGSRLRRNPRRRVAAAAKDLGAGSVEPGLGNRGRGGSSNTGKGLKGDDDEAELGFVGGKCDGQLENAGSFVGNRGRGRGGSKKNEVECIDIPDEELENAAPIAGNGGRRGGSNRASAVKENGNETELGSVSEVRDEGLENVDQVVENPGVRVGLRRGRSLKEKESENVEVVVESKPRRGRPPRVSKKMSLEEKESENVEVVVESKPPRGRPPRVKKMNNGVANVLAVVQDLPHSVSCDEVEKAPQVNLRTTRSSKMEKGSVADPAVLPNNEEISSSKTLGGLTEKSSLQDEAPDSDGTGVLEEKLNMNGLVSQDESLQAAAVGMSEEMKNVGMNGSRKETLEAAAIGASEGKENVDDVNLGSDTLKELPSGSGAKESSVNVADEVDLEKMTLGQWLDFLEDYLPKQIYEETEVMIAKMEEKSKRFEEFMAQQQKHKGGLERGVL